MHRDIELIMLIVIELNLKPVKIHTPIFKMALLRSSRLNRSTAALTCSREYSDGQLSFLSRLCLGFHDFSLCW